MASATDIADSLDEKLDNITLDRATEKTHPKTDLQTDEFGDLWYRLHVFIYDLRNFTTDDTARKRLDRVADPAYLGKPYFSAQEASLLKSIEVVPGGESLDQRILGALEERLNRRMKRRVRTEDFRVCAAHDLAPIFEKAFGISAQKLAKDAEFKALMASKGLMLSRDDSATIIGRPFEDKQSGNQKRKAVQKSKNKKQ